MRPTLLNAVVGDVTVISQSGNIIVNTSAGKILSTSKYGKVVADEISKGNNKYNLSSVTGNISINRIE